MGNQLEYYKCVRILEHKKVGICQTKYYGKEIKGYKKVGRDIVYNDSDDNSSYVQKHYFNTEEVAEITIPCNDSTVIMRPYEYNLAHNWKRWSPSNKLRTNEYTVDKISGNDGLYYSLHDPQFTYWKGRHMKQEVDPDLDKKCTRGLHFFLNKKEAESF